MEPFLANLQLKYPDLAIESLEITHNATNQQKFSKLTSEYNISVVGFPLVLIGNHALVGEVNIRNQLEEYVVEAGNTPGSLKPSPPPNVSIVVLSALVDSINPCAFSVLIFLLISIRALESRRRILLVGGVYIAAVFLFYLLSGLSLFSLISISGLSYWFSLAGAIVALGLGIVNVIDALRKKEGFLFAIPESRKESFGRYIREASLPAAFALGILVAIFELPCTGGIYFYIVGQITNGNLPLIQGLAFLVLYNFVFVLPPIAILFIVAFGVPPEEADAWRIRHRRTLRLVVGLVMIALGAFVLYGPH